MDIFWILITGVFYVVFSFILPLKKVFRIVYLLIAFVIFGMLFIEKESDSIKLIISLVMLLPLVIFYFGKKRILK